MKGENEPCVALPKREIKALLALVSLNCELLCGTLVCKVNKLVLVIAVSGVVGGVNAAVYTAVPLTTRRFDMDPLTLDGLYKGELPIRGTGVSEKLFAFVNVALTTPLENNRTVVPLLVTATWFQTL